MGPEQRDPLVSGDRGIKAPMITPEEMAQQALELWKSIENQEPIDKGDEGLTSPEYAELWGVPQSTAKKRLKQMTDQGLMVMGKAYRQWKAGYWQRKHVYRPKEEE